MKAIRGGYRIAFSFVPTHDRLPPWRAMMRGGRRRSSFFPIMNTTILNEGLSLAMEWGEQWLCPIQERLATAHPELSRPGSLVISYNVNSFVNTDHYKDVTIYRPRFVDLKFG